MKRTLAIGDIHGCLAPLELLWKTIDPGPEDQVVFIGDYVDRGPDSKGVIDFLIDLPPSRAASLPLLDDLDHRQTHPLPTP